ncbi:hypothetical protein [Rhodococcus sp. SORGH_AS_0303]|uniref:hypothetical protein n=1 Tax=Rhodococcus sp. SORGH_AS_0303 TaxID=3041753 RepID=UPI0027824242|nr:hypothetical protein [Rhodococcus sp. SORGH_AS_0303]MDQ1203148.1 hypothetical protein [Rhodococcus sp. SORGH_AS_0303]
MRTLFAFALAAGESTIGSLELYRTAPEVHSAMGMLAARLRIPIDDAAVRLRGHAYAESQPISSVARDLMRRVLDPRILDD